MTPDIAPLPASGRETLGLRAMKGIRSFGELFRVYPLRAQRVAALFVLPLVLGLCCFDLHADLLYRTAVQTSGGQGWSAVRKYSNALDTGYARESARRKVLPADVVRVFVSGEITYADVESAAVLSNLLRNGKQKIADNTVWLASNGGDIDAGMELGRLLRKWGVFTFVGKDDQCFSACVFAFMGGERRSVAGRLGIHRPYFSFTGDAPDRKARFRHMQRTLRDYVEEMDFPASLYEAVMLVPPESIRILSVADLKRFYLEGISPSSEDSADAAAARRLDLPMFDYLQRKVKSPACGFPIAGQGGCEEQAPQAGASADNQAGLPKGKAASTGQAVGQGRGGLGR